MGHFSKKSPLVKLRYHLYNIHPKSKKWQCLLLCSWNWQKKSVNHDKNIRDAQKLPKYLMSYSVSLEHTFHEYIKVQTIQFLWHLLNFRAKSQPSAFDLLHISKYFIFNTVSRTNKNSNWTRNVKLDFKRKQKNVMRKRHEIFSDIYSHFWMREHKFEIFARFNLAPTFHKLKYIILSNWRILKETFTHIF